MITVSSVPLLTSSVTEVRLPLVLNVVVTCHVHPKLLGHTMQAHAGIYNETAFLGLDMVIYEAAQAGLRLIIALANNWDYSMDWK